MKFFEILFARFATIVGDEAQRLALYIDRQRLERLFSKVIKHTTSIITVSDCILQLVKHTHILLEAMQLQ